MLLIWLYTHHYERGQAYKVSLSCIDPHGSFCLHHILGSGRQLQLPHDHLAVKRTAQLGHLEVHLKHLLQTAVKPGDEQCNRGLQKKDTDIFKYRPTGKTWYFTQH